MAIRSFWKLHGLGNDFIFFDALSNDIELSTQDVIALCDRHTGIGGDGVIVVMPSSRPECAGYMHYFNADGSLAQMCGNGVRCFAKFLVDHGYVDAHAGCLVADTLAGPKPITFQVDHSDKLTLASVNMGYPILDPAKIPTNLAATAKSPEGTAYVREAILDSPWGPFTFTCISMGNPHAICFLNESDLAALPDECFTNPTDRSLAHLKIDQIGAFFESHTAFPEKTNIEFACVKDQDEIEMRVFERGCGETYACGTGACATFVAAYLLGKAPTEANLRLLGGTLHIALNKGQVFMTGPACEVFEGTINL